jgi:NADH-quinone oxidoreductase subunit G
MVKIHIDNIEYEVKEGKNLLETILSLGMNLPYFCWHPKLGSVGACRQCAVKSFKDADDTRGKIIMSCMEPIKEGMRIAVEDSEATTFRSHITESLMTNHPHDCPTCDEGGECHLQDMTIMTGHTYRRFQFNKRTFENQYLGPLVNHEMNRCIACYRCVRFYKDYAGGKDFEVLGAHNLIYFGRHEDGVLESEFSGNLVEVCPTGVFTDKTLKKHFTRKWDYTTAPSVCNLCSLGCNIIAGERYGKIRRIRTRYNKEVNGYFLCDRGRYGYEYTNSAKRILFTSIKNVHSETGFKRAGIQEVQSEFNKIFKDGTTAKGIGSGRASLEANYALKTLVGADNFYHGMSDVDYELNHLAADILKNSSAEKYSLKEIENTECVLILGEDLTNTAPMLALAVRQSVRQRPMRKLEKLKINLWDDKTVRDAVQQKKGPLFNITPAVTKLDELAQINLHTNPQTMAAFGFAIACFMDSAHSVPENISKEHLQMAESIAETLMEAENSVIISGTSCLNGNILKAAHNIAEARAKQGKKTGICLTFQEANSLGLTLLGGKKLSEMDKSVPHNTLVILENDLYRKAPAAEIDELLKSFKNTIAIDSLMNSTTSKVNYLLPAGTIYESDGHLVNNEGRVQRFYKVFVKEDGDVRSGQEWIQMLSESVDGNPLEGLSNIFDYGKAIEKEYTVFNGLEANIVPLTFREGAQKVAREPHRYSGRTAIHAHQTVHEPTPPKDHESPMSFSMEGFHGTPRAPLTPFFWSPGWNSVQAINKFQIEIGGELRREIPQLCIFKNTVSGNGKYYKMEANDTQYRKDEQHEKWKVLPLYHIFGYEELSVVEGGIKELAPLPYIGINPETARKVGWEESTVVCPAKGNNNEGIQLRFSEAIPENCIGIPVGLEYMSFVEWGKWQNLRV